MLIMLDFASIFIANTVKCSTHVISCFTIVEHMIHSSLQAPPDLLDLLNKVAAEARDKWELVAVQLGIKPSRIHSIHTVKQGQPIHCYFEIFDVWKNKGSPPYTWATIINALRAPAVEEERLANELQKWLTQ